MGLPLHILVVHAVIVLVPLAAAGGIAISLIKWARLRYGSLVVVGAFLAMGATFTAQQAGKSFQATFTRTTEAMQRHFALGDDLLIWTILLFAGTAVVVVGQWMIDNDKPSGRIALISGIVITVVTAAVSTIQTVRIGHSGSFAVWGGA